MCRSRRLLATILCVGAVLASARGTSFGAGVCGDADGNGEVTVTDGVQVLRAGAGLSSSCTADPARCDVDGNTVVTVSDGVGVLRLAAGLPVTCTPAIPSTFNVDSITDDTDAAPGDGLCATTAHECTLRAAIQEANALSGEQTVQLGGRPYELSSGTLTVMDDLQLTGPGASTAIIDGGNGATVLVVVSGTSVTVEGVTIRHGHASNVGGGIDNHGTLILKSSVIADNVATNTGGGIENSGTVELRDTLVSGNAAGSSGGGISNHGAGVLRVVASTISGNFAGNVAGGIENSPGATASLSNTTISGNTAQNLCGGISNFGSLSLRNATIAANMAHSIGGLGIEVGGTATAANTLIADNHAGLAVDCNGTLTSAGYNLVGDAGSCTIAGDATGNLTGVVAHLEALADNGGPTPTHALAADSPARDAGNPAAPKNNGVVCLPVDQRGVVRPQHERCDIGALEAN